MLSSTVASRLVFEMLMEDLSSVGTGHERQRKIGSLWTIATDGPEHGCEEVAADIRDHVSPRLVLGDCPKFRTLEPAQQFIVRTAIALRKT
jgi:hypothetical protein